VKCYNKLRKLVTDGWIKLEQALLYKLSKENGKEEEGKEGKEGIYSKTMWKMPVPARSTYTERAIQASYRVFSCLFHA